MKKLILFICLSSFSFIIMAQTDLKYSKNKYFISMYNLHENNFDVTKDLLGRFTDAVSIEFNKTDSVFTILTYKTLNKRSVSSKMQKNYLPIKYFILEGEPIDPFPTFTNTGNQEQDAIEYEKQKTDWIKKYPSEYAKMIKSLNK